jgi:hypothetical protein
VIATTALANTYVAPLNVVPTAVPFHGEPSAVATTAILAVAGPITVVLLLAVLALPVVAPTANPFFVGALRAES